MSCLGSRVDQQIHPGLSRALPAKSNYSLDGGSITLLFIFNPAKQSAFHALIVLY
jgi:hypothetical protein